MCFDINEILVEHNLFLRVYERKDKFRYLFRRTSEKNETIKSISSCIRNTFNGFSVAAPYLKKPVRNQNDVIKCHFSTDNKLAYRGRAPQKNKIVNNVPHECYYCASFFAFKQLFETHIKCCSGKPGIVYNFNI